MLKPVSILSNLVVTRLLATLLVSYGFTWAAVAFGVAGLTALGWDFHDAQAACMILGFLLLLTLFLWLFATKRLALKLPLVALAGGVLFGLAWGVQQWVLQV